jgi:membrane carboxypeptidase/penicillin-binding protein
MNYMGTVLKGKPETPLSIPEGVVRVAINSANDLTLEGGQEGQGCVPDYIYQENVPSARRPDATVNPNSGEKSVERVKSQLF